MEDARHILENERPFSCHFNKEGVCFIYYNGKYIKTVKGKEAVKIRRKLDTLDEMAVQFVLAKATGNFKRGNERQ